MKAKHLYTAVALSLLFGATLTHAEEYGRIQWKELPGIDEPIPYPDPALTKGDLSPDRLHQVCDKDFRTSSIRADTQAMKCAVFKAYEIACHPCVKSAKVACGQFEIDHYFSLTDGGKDGSETPDDITDNLGRSQDSRLRRSYSPRGSSDIGELDAKMWSKTRSIAPFAAVSSNRRMCRLRWQIGRIST